MAQRYRSADGAWRDRLLDQFVRPGDLVFDIGAHVGDCIASLRRLEARVVAVEPQPSLARALRILHGRDRQVVLEQLAVGADRAEAEMYLNLANPSVSSLSRIFISAAQGGQAWQGQRWEGRVKVPVTTLDALIARYGEPRFCKIDVEGYEASVLQGLSCPLAALSFELTTIQRQVALQALEECERLGRYRYNAALGASASLIHAQWLSAEEIGGWIKGLPEAANSGDVYAVRVNT
ncbi:MAG: FkbM family methyltransferase [Lamprobacter sp.]|uniref:FkbM family methyltransferase n=1 Tax=Lamprobacter sp. TaxID=3100796 RepID=UPI002B26251C|nr:FkbM family methyltransferase [Lamprobacter sp.]MEA3638770.1 FkbM family methyltransferase [Lamprobacter sp.]